MRVLMVSANIAVNPYPLYPLGCSMVSSALADAGHDVRQFDFLQQGSSLEALGREITAFKPQLIGISIRNIDNVNSLNEQRYITGVRDIIASIRQVSDSKVVLGGAGFSLIPDLILEETRADYGIVGEGESLMVSFANNAAEGIFPGKRLLGPERRLSGTAIPSALYDGGIMRHYLQHGNMAQVQTKRGCTHGCVYCSYPLLEGRNIRSRAPVSVVDDIEMLREMHDIKYLFFVDSVFNDDEGAYREVLYEMKRRRVSVPWTAFFKPTGLDDGMVALMKETGLVAAEIGSDAACDTTLKGMGKSFAFADIVRANELFLRHGIGSAHFYMFGGPGETKETVLEGIENIKRLEGCVVFAYLGIRILPNTVLAARAVKENIISPSDGLLDSLYYFSPHVTKDWMEETLTGAFKHMRNVIFPPDSSDDKLKVLHKMKYIGPLWDMLASSKKVRVRGSRIGA